MYCIYNVMRYGRGYESALSVISDTHDGIEGVDLALNMYR